MKANTILKTKWILLVCCTLLFVLMINAINVYAEDEEEQTIQTVAYNVVTTGTIPKTTLQLNKVASYKGQPYTVINNNIPDFYIWQMTTNTYVSFSELDKKGRTRAAMACLSRETLPAELPEQITGIDPSGWQNTVYDSLIEDRYLYNRTQLIDYQLCGDPGCAENLFTGTAFLNSSSMLFFETMVADYLNQTEDGHVLYRVTPYYKGSNLVVSGVQMEAFSLEDFGKSVCFNVFVYNVQPGVQIDYSTGKSNVDSSSRIKKVTPAETYGALTTPPLLNYSLIPDPIIVP